MRSAEAWAVKIDSLVVGLYLTDFLVYNILGMYGSCMGRVWLIILKRSNTCLWVRFRVMVLLASGDWALWGNLTSRQDYWMFDPGRNSERVGTRSDFNGNLTRAPSAFGLRLSLSGGDSDSSDVRLAHSMDSSAGFFCESWGERFVQQYLRP